MKGLEVAEGYFRVCGAPLIERQFSGYVERIAAGLVGEGSECYGFDDEISRDHDWGPGFCVWLDQQDYQEIGASLRENLAKLPGDFEGIGPRRETPWAKGRVGVFEVGEFYKRFTGHDHVPENIQEWRNIPEINLAACTNGKVFTDPLGRFSLFRQRLKEFYPEDVRLKKIAARCVSMAQLGQYNFMRCIQREELVAARYVEAQFCSQSISMVFLLNRQYTPFYKWMHRALRGLPILGEVIYRLLSDVVTSLGTMKKSQAMEEICAVIIQELRRQGLSDSPSDFLLDHAPVVHSKIQDLELRSTGVGSE